MFNSQLTQAGHTRRFSIQRVQDESWEVCIEEDSRIVRRSRYSDWHRVERALLLIEREVADLVDLGWRRTSSSHDGCGSTAIDVSQ